MNSGGQRTLLGYVHVSVYYFKRFTFESDSLRWEIKQISHENNDFCLWIWQICFGKGPKYLFWKLGNHLWRKILSMNKLILTKNKLRKTSRSDMKSRTLTYLIEVDSAIWFYLSLAYYSYVEHHFKSVVTLFRQECLYEKQIDDDLATFYLSCSNFSACKESQQSPIVLPKTSSS